MVWTLASSTLRAVPEVLDPVQSLPGEDDVGPAEMAVAGGRGVDRPAEIEVRHEGARGEFEALPHDRLEDRLRQVPGSTRLDSEDTGSGTPIAYASGRAHVEQARRRPRVWRSSGRP
jgi:hypothetical protein